MSTVTKEKKFKGLEICEGIAIGYAYCYQGNPQQVREFEIEKKEVDTEIKRYQSALAKARQDIHALSKQLKNDAIDEGAAILEAHLQILDDEHFNKGVIDAIRTKRINAEAVFSQALDEIRNRFSSMDDHFFRDRFGDIQDVAKRVLDYLHDEVSLHLADIPRESIVIAEELSASDTAEAKAGNINGFVTLRGGPTSHAAIVAKAKGIPYVTSVQIENAQLENGMLVIVDGYSGTIHLNPTKKTVEKYQTLRKDIGKRYERLAESNDLPAETYDGYTIQLSANVEMVNDIDLVRANGGQGVGLFRSEYIFLSSDEMPSEQDQVNIYRSIIKRMKGLPIVIRTFDIGGDKQLPKMKGLKLRNPFVGQRAMQYLLKEKSLLKTQLRAIMRASTVGPLSILFPMVTSLSEILQAKALLAEVMDELSAEGKSFDEDVRVGCMIEVPSAAIISDLLAKECDFLSIGTNDLVQYSLAVDRGNYNYQTSTLPTHPCVLRLIRLIVTEANHHGIPVSICGEMAADPRFTPLLLGLGVHELSLSSRYIPLIKNMVRNCSIVAASRLAEEALTLTTAEEIMSLITKEYRSHVPEDC